MNLAITVVAFYGMFNLVGGGIGYLKAKSRASLIAGSISGILLLFQCRDTSCGWGLVGEALSPKWAVP